MISKIFFEGIGGSPNIGLLTIEGIESRQAALINDKDGDFMFLVADANIVERLSKLLYSKEYSDTEVQDRNALKHLLEYFVLIKENSKKFKKVLDK